MRCTGQKYYDDDDDDVHGTAGSDGDEQLTFFNEWPKADRDVIVKGANLKVGLGNEQY